MTDAEPDHGPEAVLTASILAQAHPFLSNAPDGEQVGGDLPVTDPMSDERLALIRAAPEFYAQELLDEVDRLRGLAERIAVAIDDEREGIDRPQLREVPVDAWLSGEGTGFGVAAKIARDTE